MESYKKQFVFIAGFKRGCLKTHFEFSKTYILYIHSALALQNPLKGT
jgi:hypothetical protein